LAGYQQLEAIALALHQVNQTCPENNYFQQLSARVDRTLEKNRTLANNLKETHQWLHKIAACLRYPPKTYAEETLTGEQVAQEVEALQRHFQPDPKHQRPQAALCHRLQRLWDAYGEQLLPCYDIPGLPPDTFQLENLFGRLRGHQRRISGRKSTRELNKLGHYQVLFKAESETELLEHLRKVPLEDYQAQRRKIMTAELSSQFLHRLHHDPESTMKRLADQYVSSNSEDGQDNQPTSIPGSICSI
jgi:hypothetical protein